MLPLYNINLDVARLYVDSPFLVFIKNLKIVNLFFKKNLKFIMMYVFVRSE